MSDEQRDVLTLLNRYFPGCVKVHPDVGGNRNTHLAEFPTRGKIRLIFEYLTPKNKTGLWGKREYVKNTGTVEIQGLADARKLIDVIREAEGKEFSILPEMTLRRTPDDFERFVDIRLRIECFRRKGLFFHNRVDAQNPTAHQALGFAHKRMLQKG